MTQKPYIQNHVEYIRARLADLEGAASDRDAEHALSRLAYVLVTHRSLSVTSSYLSAEDRVVRSGPFAGLNLVSIDPIASAALPKLIGCYEHEIHPIIELICATAYGAIFNLGCAEGYYAVGFARRMKDTLTLAVDIEPTALNAVRALAKHNGVSDRVKTQGAVTPNELNAKIGQALSAGRSCLVFCDVEGAEDDLLDPAACPSLTQCDIFAETHPALKKGVDTRLRERFEATHKIQIIEPGATLPAITLPPRLARMPTELDRLLAIWEKRGAPTPWLWMTKRG